MMSIRPFKAKDIPLEFAGFWGAVIFNFSEFNKNLFKGNDKFDMHSFKDEIELVMGENPITSPNDIDILKEKVANRFNEKFYPSYGIKEDTPFNIPQFPGSGKSTLVDIISGMYGILPDEVDSYDTSTEEERSEYMETLIDEYGFSYKEAKEVLSKDSFTQTELFELLEKVHHNTQEKLKDKILADIVEKFRGKN
jgi:hypothetical protein